ncbi:XdhC family protein [Paracoccus sp. (in: a-proteobacteria)]|uniref:XdhC family protein n=1 Tax=Paracoccus sp. TaxID=267 RepID=UPI002729AA79|nr:XdhC family protein [Paracoccus sp. (in: a-proteobacteria)]
MNPHDLAALRLLARAEGALCTLTRIEGSFSRATGAHLAVAWDGRMRGALADGCLEAELALQAQRLRGREATTLRYGRGSPVIDFRLPCGSGLDILIDPAPDRRAIRAVLRDLAARRPAVLALPDPALPQRLCLPPLQLEVFGAGPECRALSRLARVMGIASALHPSGRPPARRPDPWTAVLLLSHDHERDEPILDWALDSEACHIAAIGGARARQRRAERLAARHDPGSLSRLRSPAGLIPATRDPATLALSVLAEAVAAHQAQVAAFADGQGARLRG